MSDEGSHGTTGGYTNHRCRCAACRAAWAAWFTTWKARNRGRAQVHGTSSSYSNYSCRCAPCTKANTDAARERRHRRAS